MLGVLMMGMVMGCDGDKTEEEIPFDNGKTVGEEYRGFWYLDGETYGFAIELKEKNITEYECNGNREIIKERVNNNLYISTWTEGNQLWARISKDWYYHDQESDLKIGTFIKSDELTFIGLKTNGVYDTYIK
jgi:hypothetical protein